MSNIRTTVEEAINGVQALQTQERPPLIPLDTPNLPRLTGGELPTWAGHYVQGVAHATETPLELATAMVLAACATASARRYEVRVSDGYTESTNLWLAAALTAGSRKSAVQSSAAAPLLSWEKFQAKKLEPEITRINSEIKTTEARVNALRSKAAKAKVDAEAVSLAAQAAQLEADMPVAPKVPQLWTSDVTPEKLGVILKDNGEKMAWLSSEGGIFDMLGGRYSGGVPNLDLVLKSHAGDPERVDRGSRPPVFLKRPLLTVGLSPQPDVLRGLSTKPGFRGRGLLARFLILLPPSVLGYRTLETKPIPQNVEANYHSGIYAILDMPAQKNADDEIVPYVLNLSAEAFAEWKKFAKFVEQEMRPNGLFEQATDWAGKAPGAAARIAGVMHVIEHAHGQPHQTSISINTMQRAAYLTWIIAQHSMFALDIMGADPTVTAARKLWQWIEQGRQSQFTVRYAHQKLKGTFPRVKGVEDALEVLVERGYVTVVETVPAGVGRPPSASVTVRAEIAQAWGP